MDSNLRREIILEHYQDPVHKGLHDDSSYLKINTRSDSCIDNLDFMLKVNDNNIIEDICFDGEACAISTSASSIIIKNLLGKNVEEARVLLDNYQKMIEEKDYDKELLGELIVYDEIGKQPNRINCALLPKRAVMDLLDQIK